MSVDLTTIIVALLPLLVGGGSVGLIQGIRADRRRKREAAAAKTAAAPMDDVTVTEAIRKLARDAVADANADVAVARSEASAARLEAADAKAMVDVLSRQLAQATQHIRDLEPLLRAGGIHVPPWPPDPDDQTPVISNDRRRTDDPFEGPERRRHPAHPKEATSG